MYSLSEHDCKSEREEYDFLPEFISWCLTICHTCDPLIFSEQPVCKLCKASVMIYDDNERKWKTAGMTSGLSGACVYHHKAMNTFRVVARKEADGEVCVSTEL